MDDDVVGERRWHRQGGVGAMHTFDAEQCCAFVGAVEVGGRGWVGSTGVGMQDLRRM
jgi:hypothetical protein